MSQHETHDTDLRMMVQDHGKPTVFILDDDRTFQAFAKLVIESLGWGCDIFSSIREIQKELELRVPELLIVDGLLPDGNGLDFIEQCIASQSEPPKVVFLSAFFRDMKSYQQLRALGVERVLTKPIGFDEFVAELSPLLRGVATQPRAAAQKPKAAPDALALDDAFAQLKEEFLRELANQAVQLDQVHTQLASGGEIDRKGFRSLVHNMAGTAGSYGFEEISTQAARLETALANEEAPETLQPLLDRLIALLGLAESKPLAATEHRATPFQVTQKGVSFFNRILLIQDASESADSVQRDLEIAGVAVERAHSAAQAFFLLETHSFDALIFDLGREQEPWLTEILVALREHLSEATPIAILIHNEDFNLRVRASTNGANLFFTKPVSGSDVLRQLEQGLAANLEEACILLVDDDPSVHRIVGKLLEPLGAKLNTARDAESFWASISDETPTLILMDSNLPVYSGFELCRVIKADPRFRNIPVVFCSAATSVADRTTAFDAGADEYILKPLVPQEFMARIASRLKAAIQFKQAAQRDALTGLLARGAIEDALQRIFAFHRRSRHYSESAPGILLFDLDDFKKLNDAFGHNTGDEALRAFASVLRRSLRASDYVGRWGGEEFLVVLPSTTPAEMERLFKRLQAQLAETPIADPLATASDAARPVLQITASAGGAQICHDTLPQWVERADAALYRAKAAGKNRLVLAASPMRLKSNPNVQLALVR